MKKRNLFAELAESLEALDEERAGKRALHNHAVVAKPATDAAQKVRRHSGDFRTFVIDAPVLNEPPLAERQIELAKRSELTRDDFEELTGFQPEKNPATGKYEIGLYVIDDNGIRPKWSREDILEWRVSERHLIENQELRFPCTPCQLVEFTDRGGFDGSFHNVLPDAFREAATLVPPDTPDTVDVPPDTLPAASQENWRSLWWATDYDLFLLAQDFGESLVNENKTPSTNAIVKKLLDHINQREKRIAGLNTPREISRTRLVTGPFKGWKYEKR